MSKVLIKNNRNDIAIASTQNYAMIASYMNTLELATVDIYTMYYFLTEHQSHIFHTRPEGVE